MAAGAAGLTDGRQDGTGGNLPPEVLRKNVGALVEVGAYDQIFIDPDIARCPEQQSIPR